MAEFSGTHFLLNGQLTPTGGADVFFRPGKHYIYEVFRVINGIPLFIEDHLGRFFQTLELVGYPSQYPTSALLQQVMALIDANGKAEGNIKISIAPDATGKENLLIYYTPHQYPTQQQFSEGVPVKLLQAMRVNPQAKVMDVTLRAETDALKSAEAYEILLVDEQGFITEGSRSNVFFMLNDALVTSPSETVLSGVTRKQVIAVCRAHGIAVAEQKFAVTDLPAVSGVFLTGTSRKVLPVCRVDEISYPVNHPLMLEVRRLFDEYVADYLESNKM